MNTLETDIEVSADGNLRLLSPLPAWLPPGRNHVLLVMADEGSRGIEKTDGVCGGDACIANTRIPVWTLEQSRRTGFLEADLLDAYPSLKRSNLEAAWKYVTEHAAEIESAIRDNEEA